MLWDGTSRTFGLAPTKRLEELLKSARNEGNPNGVAYSPGAYSHLFKKECIRILGERQ